MEGVDGLMSRGDDLSLSTDGLRAFTGPMNQIEVNGPMNQIIANGLQRVEKQSRWTRLTRMDFGPMDLFKEGAKSILGKRGSQGMQQDMLTKVMNRQKRKLSLGMVLNHLKQRGCCNTLAESNEDFKLELLRAWEPLDSSKPS